MLFYVIPYICIKCYTNNKKSSIGGVGKVTDRTQGKLSQIGQVWELDGWPKLHNKRISSSPLQWSNFYLLFILFNLYSRPISDQYCLVHMPTIFQILLIKRIQRSRLYFDTTLYFIFNTIDTTFTPLNHAVDLCAKWCNTNEMTIHPAKCETMIMTISTS